MFFMFFFYLQVNVFNIYASVNVRHMSPVTFAVILLPGNGPPVATNVVLVLVIGVVIQFSLC